MHRVMPLAFALLGCSNRVPTTGTSHTGDTPQAPSDERSVGFDAAAPPDDHHMAGRDGGGAPRDDDALVDVHALDPSIRLDIRYATTANFTGVAVYPIARCLLRRPVAEALVRVQERLAAQGLGVVVWDCYRPFSVQQAFWRLVPDARYVAEPVVRDGVPVEGSKHNRGAAVDLTLATLAGVAVEMPTGYDDFSARAHRGDPRASATARRHAKVLEDAMLAEGFEPLPTEWWHYDGPGWRRYDIADIPLE